MAKPTRTLTVNFVGRTDQLDKAYKRVNKGSQNMSATLTRGLRTGMTAFAGIGAAAAGFVALTKPMVDIAADVGESMSKNKTLFGEASESVAKFAKTASVNFGLSNRDALEAAGNFGALTHAMGMSGEEGADMSITMVKLAADMASFNNASPEETLTALAAGLRGENEPLRRFGILLDAATLKTKALEMGLIENTKSALDPATKALAAYASIMEKSTVQQGDFERTSDGLANKQRTLSAQFTNLAEEIGLALLPIFEEVTTVLVESGIPNLEKFIAVWKDEGFLTALGKVAERLAEIRVDHLADEAKQAAELLAGGVMVVLNTLKDSVNSIFTGIPENLEAIAPGLLDSMIGAFSPLFGWLEGMASTAAGWWNTIFGGDQADTGAAVGSVMGDIRRDTGQASAGMAGFNPNVGPDPLFGMGATATDEEIAQEIDQFEEMAKAAAATVKAPPRTPGATLLDPRAAAFQSASLAGGAHTITVNINAPAVTTADVNAAVANGFKNDAMLLEQLYFI